MSNVIDISSPEMIGRMRESNRNLNLYYKEDLGAVLRYMFDGFVVPIEIQEDVVLLRKSLPVLLKDIKLPFILGGLKIVSLSQKNDCSRIEYIKGNKTYVVTLTITVINDWGCHPITEIEFQGKKYRSIPYNGDVYNHIHHQQGFFDNNYLKPSIEQGVISLDNANLMSIFHEVHDIPEIIKGDQQYGTKNSGDAVEESTIIKKLIQNADVNIDYDDENLYSELFEHLENPKNFFKGGEKLNYINDVINIFTLGDKSHLNNPELFIHKVLVNQLPSFYTRDQGYVISDFNDLNASESVLLSDLEASKTFFEGSKSILNNIICYNELDNTGSLKRDWENIIKFYGL